jgi:glycine/D-amino acid oxidase-like deaminating enzyme
MGPIRMHDSAAAYAPPPREGWADRPDGADVLLGSEVGRAFPYLSSDAVAALHVRRAGWLNAVALGAWMLTRALAAGASFVRGRVDGVLADGGQVHGVRLASGDVIETERLVIAAGPQLPAVAKLMDLELPVVQELHAKLIFRDVRRAVSRDAPFVIWTDPVQLDWSDDERRALARDKETRRLTEMLPGGVHLRPVDLDHGDELYLIWTFENDQRPYAWPPSFNPHYGDVVLKGAAAMVPGLAAYDGQAHRGTVDGGFYCKTPENRPLVGPLPVRGAYVLGALSGFGIMASHAAAELVALHVTERPLPDYARWFLPSRYEDAAYRALVDEWGPLVGQL